MRLTDATHRFKWTEYADGMRMMVAASCRTDILALCERALDIYGGHENSSSRFSLKYFEFPYFRRRWYFISFDVESRRMAGDGDIDGAWADYNGIRAG